METPVRIEIAGGQSLILEWEDEAASELSAAVLRDACACADCRAKAVAKGPVVLRLQAPTAVTIADAHLVGSYGINLTFGPDGHRTGIFTFTQLKDLAGNSDTST